MHVYKRPHRRMNINKPNRLLFHIVYRDGNVNPSNVLNKCRNARTSTNEHKRKIKFHV